REANLLDGGAPFYDSYACLDGKFIAIGAIEPQFYAQLLSLLELEDPVFTRRWDKAHWPDLKAKFSALFATRSRDAWCRLLEGSDACFAPVLDMAEAPRHPHNAARRSFVDIDGVTQPAPAPRFSRTPPATPAAPSMPGGDSAAILSDWGFTEASIEALKAGEVI
ncbi:MAG: CoA transferase, partial [Telluria sp.]